MFTTHLAHSQKWNNSKVLTSFDTNITCACYEGFFVCVSYHSLFLLLLLAASLSGEAVFARCLSSLKEERVEASRSLPGPQGVKYDGNKAAFLEDIRKVELAVLTNHCNTTLHCWSGLFLKVPFYALHIISVL